MQRRLPGWTLAVSAVAIFMVSLDNLVVSNALTSIREDLGASLEALEWTVNAYTLAFAVFLLTGAALGDRLGRRRVFVAGLGIFTLASAAAALAPSTEALIAARAVQGLGAGIVAPLSLTLLSTATAPERRGLALGIWSGISGLGVALGPLVGGAVIEGISWQWIFWLNVPVGLVLAPLALRRLDESHGPARRLDLRGLALASLGLLGVVFGVVRGNPAGWGSLEVVAPIAAGAALLVGFVLWELRAPAPMLPMRFFRSRAFAATNGVSLTMTFGIFGSIFLLAQFFQTVQGYSPLEAGLRTLPWTGMPMLVAPIAGVLSDRIGARPLLSAGLFLQAVALDVARARLRAGRRVRHARAGLRAGRHRDGARLRPRGERGARRRAAGGGRAGVGRDERDPRARRRPRRRGPRRRVLRRRRLRDAGRVRRRARPRAVGRRRRARARRADRPARAGPPPRRGARRRGAARPARLTVRRDRGSVPG